MDEKKSISKTTIAYYAFSALAVVLLLINYF